MAAHDAPFHPSNTASFKVNRQSTTRSGAELGSLGGGSIAMLLTAKLMLDWLKETDMATRLEAAVARVIAEGKVRTYDMGGKDSTLDVAKAIADYAS